jgi:hypothetical protein
VQTRLVPAECVQITAVVHQSSLTDTWCLSIEVKDPHTSELLGLFTDPSMKRSDVTPPATWVTLELRTILLDLFDPDPF